MKESDIQKYFTSFPDLQEFLCFLRREFYFSYLYNDKVYRIDYRIIGKTDDLSEDAIILIQGYGSGWLGMSELAYQFWSLTKRPVILVSSLGTGNSDDPPLDWFKDQKNFENEASFYFKFLNYLKVKKILVIAHSMGSVVSTTLGLINSKIISKLVLLNPAGILKKSPWEMIENMYKTDRDFQKVYKLNKYNSPFFIIKNEFSEKSPYWGKVRKLQRWSEFVRLYSASITKDNIEKIRGRLKTLVVSGEFDKLFPAMEMQEFFGQQNIPFKIIKGAFHNTTVMDSREVAETVLLFK